MNSREVQVLTQSIQTLLAAIGGGRMRASAATRHRLEGALVALEVIEGNDPTALWEALGLDSK